MKRELEAQADLNAKPGSSSGQGSLPLPEAKGQWAIELTEKGYLILPVELAQKYFPSDNLVALAKGNELRLLPVNSSSYGGLILKHRNKRGDRSVLLVEVLTQNMLPGVYVPIWHNDLGALVVKFEESVSAAKN